MIPAQAAAHRPPARLAVLYLANGVPMGDWTPQREGPGFDFRRCLAPLSRHAGALSILTGLAQNNGCARGDGPGDHARAMASFLTGCHPRKTAGAGIRAGVSMDQVAAAHFAGLTPLRSLELGIESNALSGECDSGYSCAYSSSLSWRSPTLPAGKEIDPGRVFDRIYGVSRSDHHQPARTSVLDLVRNDASRLVTVVGGSDRAKIEEYLGGVRELELRMEAAKTVPFAEPPFDRPESIPPALDQRIRLMLDLLLAAFEADRTRVATLLFTNEASNRSYPFLGVPEGHHDISHHGGSPEKQEKLARITRFYSEQVAYFLDGLARRREAGRSLLEGSVVVYGSGLSDGDKHSHDDLPIVVAGKGHGWLRAAHRRYPKTPLCNLFVSVLAGLGAPVERFGDSTGALEGLDRNG